MALFRSRANCQILVVPILLVDENESAQTVTFAVHDEDRLPEEAELFCLHNGIADCSQVIDNCQRLLQQRAGKEPSSSSSSSFSDLVTDCSSTNKREKCDKEREDVSIKSFATLHTTQTFWSEREKWVSDRIQNNSVVLDLGAGTMHLEKVLYEAGKTVEYLPVDVTDRLRSDDRQIYCNFNNNEYPMNVTPTPTVVVIQGLFEYIYDKFLFLKVIATQYPQADILMTYALNHRLGAHSEVGWIMPLTTSQFDDKFLKHLGLIHVAPSSECYPGQMCMHLRSERLTRQLSAQDKQ